MLSNRLKKMIISFATKAEVDVVKKFLDNYQIGKIVKTPKEISIDGTFFQKKVLEAVCKIPYGETRSYSDIAKSIGKPKATRAVASAIAKNKQLIVIPCHRVIKSSGEIGEYNAGSKIKQKLLLFEMKNIKKPDQT